MTTHKLFHARHVSCFEFTRTLLDRLRQRKQVHHTSNVVRATVHGRAAHHQCRTSVARLAL